MTNTNEYPREPIIRPDCGCATCRPMSMTDMRMILCAQCGNKRCPHAADHRLACTNSNEPGQPGSNYPRVPAPADLPRFPTMLRKMWSGGEVQAWLDEHVAPVVGENAYVEKRLAESLAEVYATILGDDAPDQDDSLNAIERVKKAAQVLRLEVDLYRANAANGSVGWQSVLVERSYDMRAKALIAFNTAEHSGKDRDDALDEAWRAMLGASPAAPQPALTAPAVVQDDGLIYEVSNAVGNVWYVVSKEVYNERDWALKRTRPLAAPSASGDTHD